MQIITVEGYSEHDNLGNRTVKTSAGYAITCGPNGGYKETRGVAINRWYGYSLAADGGLVEDDTNSTVLADAEMHHAILTARIAAERATDTEHINLSDIIG